MNKLSTFNWGTQGVHKYDSTHQTNLLEPLLCFKVKDFHFPFLLSLPKMSLAMTNFTTTTKLIWWWNQFLKKKKILQGKGWKCWKMCRKFWQSLSSCSFQNTFENPHQRKVDQMLSMRLSILSCKQFEDIFEKAQRRKWEKWPRWKKRQVAELLRKSGLRSHQPLSLHSCVDTLWENMKGLCRTRW